MKVDKINAYKELFREHLEVTQSYNELYKYDALAHFQQNWDLGVLDLAATYNKSFSSELSGRLWGGSQNSAKEMMLKFIEQDKEFVRSMFRDLYDEKKDLGMRVNRFQLHCDELLTTLHEKHPNQNHHYHTTDEVGLYLAFNAPETYALYHYASFSIMMQRLDSRSIPEAFETERYFKLCSGLYKLLSRDQLLVDLHISKRGEYYDQPTMLMVNDFISICSKGPIAQ